MEKIKKFAIIFCLSVVGLLVAFRALSVLRERDTNKQAAPKTGSFVKAGDVEFFIQEAGSESDQAVIFIHGLGAWSETWRPTMKFLADRKFHVIAIDLPPFGFSSRPDDRNYSRGAQAARILKLIDELKLKKPIIVGHSFGARAALTAALRGKDQFKKLVLVNAALGLTTESMNGNVKATQPGFAAKLMGLSPLRNLVISLTLANPLMTNTLLGEFVFNTRSITSEVVEVYQKPMTVRGSMDSFGDWLQDFFATNENALLSDVKAYGAMQLAPSLIWGDKDSITPLWQARALNQLMPGSSLKVLKNVGHIPQIEANREFNDLLFDEIK